MKEKRWWVVALLALLALVSASCAAGLIDGGDDVGVRQEALLSTTRSLPFLAGQRIGIAQGTNGTPTHVGSLYNAIDFGLSGVTDRGLPVVATNDGVVVSVTSGVIDVGNQACGFGNTIVYCSTYTSGPCERMAHLREVFVVPGESVRKGQVIALLGSSGYSDAPHLHNQMQSTSTGTSVTSSYYYRETKTGTLQTGSWVDTGRPGVEVCNSSPTNPCAISENEGLMGVKAAQFTSGQLGSVTDPRTNLEQNEGWSGYGWYAAFTQCTDADGDSETTCDNESGYRRNAYVRRYTGGSFVNTAIVYDALSGSTSAYAVKAGFLKNAQNGWDTLGGPTSILGMPLEDERTTSTGSEQCFQWGKLMWNSSTNAVTRTLYSAAAEGGKSIGPGVYAPDGVRTVHYWKRGASYRIADAWLRNGGKPQLGEPASDNGADPGAHKWAGTRFVIQNFKGGSFGDAAVMYDPEVAQYAGANVNGSVPATGWNRAYVIRTAFWNWYRYNNGIGNLKAPIGDEYTQSGGSRQDFLCGYLVWNSSTGVVTPTLTPSAAGCNLSETAFSDDTCHTPKPSDATQVGFDTGGDGSPTQHVISCTMGPTDMWLQITGPIQDGLFAPVSGSTVYLEYGSDTDGWGTYTSGKPKATWIGDMATTYLPRTYTMILGKNVQNMNFFMYDPASGHVEWFDLSKWTVVGDCWKQGTVIAHAAQPTPKLTCSLTPTALTINIDGPIQSLLTGAAVSNPTYIEYGSNTDGWSVPYSSGKPKSAWNGTNQQTLTIAPNIYNFNLYLTNGTTGQWFDLVDPDSDGDKWTVAGDCYLNGTTITHAAPPATSVGTINCQVNGPDMTITVNGNVPAGIYGTPPTDSPTYMEYGSDTDGWGPYVTGKPKNTWSTSFNTYVFYVGANVSGFNMFLYGPNSGQVNWFDLTKWTVTGSCYLSGTKIMH